MSFRHIPVRHMSQFAICRFAIQRARAREVGKTTTATTAMTGPMTTTMATMTTLLLTYPNLTKPNLPPNLTLRAYLTRRRRQSIGSPASCPLLLS